MEFKKEGFKIEEPLFYRMFNYILKHKYYWGITYEVSVPLIVQYFEYIKVLENKEENKEYNNLFAKQYLNELIDSGYVEPNLFVGINTKGNIKSNYVKLSHKGHMYNNNSKPYFG